MMNLGIIAAISSNGVIGKDGKIPWRIPEDMKRFKEVTMWHPIIMGRKTYESIGRPLPDRLNIVLSRGNFSGENIHVHNSLESAVDYLESGSVKNFDLKKIYIIGGRSVYEEALPFSNFLEITEVNGNYEGDVYFPEVDWNRWSEIDRMDFDDYSFVSYRRIKRRK